MKEIFRLFTSIIFSFLITSAFSQTPNNVPLNGLIGYWPFNGNANNSTLNNLNGVVSGAALSSDRNSNVNSAYSFSTSSNYISIQNNSLLSLNNSDFTINAWVKLDNLPSLSTSTGQYNQYFTILGKRQNGAGLNNYSIGISTPSSPVGAGKLVFAQGPGGVGSFVSSTNPISLGLWCNISVTYKLSTQTLKLYVNNTLVNQQTGVSIPGENSANFWFGNDVASSATYFPGTIDDIGIWNRELSLTELSLLQSPCNFSITPPTINIIGSTTICQGDSVVLISSSSTGNTWSTGDTSQTITVSQGGSFWVSNDTANCIVYSDPIIVSVLQMPDSIQIYSSGSISSCEGDSVILSLNSFSSVRYLMYESYFSSDNGQVNVYEIQALSNGENVALNKSGFANSYEYGNWLNNGKNAVDGNSSTRWSSDRDDIGPDTINPHFILIDLGSIYNLEFITLNLSNFQQTFSLKVSQDSINWFEVGAGELVTGIQSFSPPLNNYTSYLWSNGETTPSITVYDSGSYFLTVGLGSSCSSISNVENVVFNPIPEFPIISASGPLNLCEGESVVLTSSNSTGNFWSNGATSQSIVVTQSGIYTVNSGLCGAISAPVHVVVSQAPDSIQLVPIGMSSICEGDSVLLSPNSLLNIRYVKYESVNNPNGTGHVSELQVFSNGINLALNSPGYASSYGCGNNNWATCGIYAVDGNSGTTWSGNSTPTETNPQFIVIDLEQTQAGIDSINLEITSYQSFNLKVSQDGVFWTELGSGQSVTGTFSFNLDNNIINYSSYLWSNGETTPSIFVTDSGSYYVTTHLGLNCSFTSNTINVVVHPSPEPPMISASGPLNVCQGDTVFINSSTNSNLTYQWYGSNGNILDNQINPSFNTTSPGSFFLAAENEFGCIQISNTLTVENYLLPDSMNNIVNICGVSVDTTINANKIIWERPTSAYRIWYYNIYREVAADIYNLVGTVLDTALTEFVDSFANPSVQSFRYKISFIDSCSFESVKSDFHRTIHLSSNMGINGEVNLLWNAYEGFSYPTFNILRSVNGSSFESIAQMSSNSTSYSDINPPIGLKNYMISIDIPNGGCSPNKSYGSIISNRIIAGLASIDFLEESTIEVFPNPSNGQLNIVFSDPSNGDFRSYEIVNSLGKILIEFDVMHNEQMKTIDMNSFANGVYFLKEKNGNRMKQIVLNRL